ncbi:hybrid sensor histidine kinase/response regulator [Xanthomonas arboricola]|uniref:hybrid sensor histidine kinase/response regulator n=1 Tax=Xanthomonas arboricola TaxID=56448 RepID=UPI001FD6F207|nr:hybrid sensor histidine kinase/response regulator [Xanthomonas arboricola]UOT00379.1 hybrid sensor histidine kinase/response regulator [Xanthomonas arboricola]
MNLTATGLAAHGNGDEPAKLLIVDDVPQNLVAMEALLQRDGLQVLCAASGAQALELLLEHDVALALLDVHMPEMDGFSLAELMRGSQRSRHVPIIFLTASPNDPMRAFQGYETGAVDFLHKPIEPHVILSKVNVFIELYQQRRLLKARNASLERALTLNETMMAVLTHDLRTPLSVILLCADKLSLDVDADGSAARTLDHLENSARRMARMVEQLLDFSRLRSDGLSMQFGPCNLGEVTHSVVGEVAQANPHTPIDLRTEGDLDGDGDGDRLAQVVSNLVGNAVLHGGSQPVRVHLDGRERDTLRLSVRNVGRIPDSLMPRLFEPFKASFHASQGLGLGLFIADQFVKAHGGTLQARNESGDVVFEAVLRRHNLAA